MKVETSPESLKALQALMDRSVNTAGPSASVSVAWPERQMSAGDLCDFWSQTGVVGMTTVGPNGRPHSAPVHARLLGDRLRLVVYTDTVRRRDIRTNPHVSFTTWGPGGAAVILYGRAEEVKGSERAARTAQNGQERNVVEIEVDLYRVYAMAARPETNPPARSD